MRRILEPGQIEAFAEGAIPRLRLPDRTRLFAARGQRLAPPGGNRRPGPGNRGQPAFVAEAQQVALRTFEAPLPTATQIAQSHTHGMPLIHASGWPREREWRDLVEQLCGSVAGARGVLP